MLGKYTSRCDSSLCGTGADGNTSRRRRSNFDMELGRMPCISVSRPTRSMASATTSSLSATRASAADVSAGFLVPSGSGLGGLPISSVAPSYTGWIDSAPRMTSENTTAPVRTNRNLCRQIATNSERMARSRERSSSPTSIAISLAGLRQGACEMPRRNERLAAPGRGKMAQFSRALKRVKRAPRITCGSQGHHRMKFRETAIVSGGLLVQQATVFATGVLIARQLGAADFGTLGTLKSLATVLVIVTPLGLDLALLKHATFYHERPDELRTLSRALRLLVGGLNLLLLGLVVVWLGGALQDMYRDIPDFARLCAITMVGIVFATDVQISGALYRVYDRVIAYALIVNYSQPILRLAVTALVLLAGGGLLGVVWVNSALFFYAFAVIGLNDRRRRGRAMPLRGDAHKTRPLHGAAHQPMPLGEVAHKVGEVLSESLWMAMTLLVYQLIRLVDILILAALTTTQITGEYTAMSSVAQLIQIYPIAISQTLGPKIAFAYKQGDLDGIRLELQAYQRRASMLGGYLFGGVAVFGVDLDLVFGHGFSFSWPLALLLASGWYVSATLAPFGYVLSMTGRHRQELVILIAGAALLVACLLLLIPPLAAVGAALAVAITFAAVNAVRCVYVIRVLARNPLRITDVLPPLCFLAAALMARGAGGWVSARSLPVLVVECLAYSLLAGSAYVVLLASTAERQTIRSLARAGRLS